MQTEHKPKPTLTTFSPAQIAAAKAAAGEASKPDGIDWSRATVTPGGGVAATISSLRQTRGKNRRPTKEQVAIRLDVEVLTAFRAGRSWLADAGQCGTETLAQ